MSPSARWFVLKRIKRHQNLTSNTCYLDQFISWQHSKYGTSLAFILYQKDPVMSLLFAPWASLRTIKDLNERHCEIFCLMENNVRLVVNIFPLPHLLVLPLCVCSIISIFSSTSLSPGHISLRGQSPGNYSVAWEGDTTSSLTQTRCYKSTLFFFFLGVGGEFSHLDPIASSVHLALRKKPADKLDNSNTHQTQTQPLLAHLGGQERTHAAARDRASDSDLIHVTEQHRATTMGQSVTKNLPVETSSSSNFVKNEPKFWKHWSCAVDRNDVNIAFFHC